MTGVQTCALPIFIGWQEGYQGSPKIEEQRLTDAYEAGYKDGESKTVDNAEKFKK